MDKTYVKLYFYYDTINIIGCLNVMVTTLSLLNVCRKYISTTKGIAQIVCEMHFRNIFAITPHFRHWMSRRNPKLICQRKCIFATSSLLHRPQELLIARNAIGFRERVPSSTLPPYLLY